MRDGPRQFQSEQSLRAALIRNLSIARTRDTIRQDSRDPPHRRASRAHRQRKMRARLVAQRLK